MDFRCVHVFARWISCFTCVGLLFFPFWLLFYSFFSCFLLCFFVSLQSSFQDVSFIYYILNEVFYFIHILYLSNPFLTRKMNLMPPSLFLGKKTNSRQTRLVNCRKKDKRKLQPSLSSQTRYFPFLSPLSPHVSLRLIYFALWYPALLLLLSPRVPTRAQGWSKHHKERHASGREEGKVCISFLSSSLQLCSSLISHESLYASPSLGINKLRKSPLTTPRNGVGDGQHRLLWLHQCPSLPLSHDETPASYTGWIYFKAPVFSFNAEKTHCIAWLAEEKG